MKRLLCLLSAVLLLSGCRLQLPALPDSSDPSSVQEGGASFADRLVLGYLQQDSLHPYRAVSSVNRAIAALLYQGLTQIDADDVVTRPCLGQDLQYDEATRCASLTLSAAVFSDGSAVTVSDVRASLQAARNSAGYGNLVAVIERMEADGATLRFYFDRYLPDPFAALSFPIVRENGSDLPLGSGPYDYQDGTLYAVDRHTRLQSIGLRGYRDLSALRRARAVGEITYWADSLSGGFVPRFSGGSEKMLLNSFALLAFHPDSIALQDINLRVAVSQAIDRTVLAQDAFEGYAVPEQSLFPDWWKLTDESPEKKSEETVANLKQLRYNTNNNARKGVSLTLGVCRENAFYTAAAACIARQLQALSVTVTVAPLSAQQLQEQWQQGLLDLYLGQASLQAHGDLSDLLAWAEPATEEQPIGICTAAYASGDMVAFCAAFEQSLPFIPLVRRMGTVSFARNLQHALPSEGCPFPQIQQWYFSES